MQSPEEFVKDCGYPSLCLIAMVSARDAEWQARVDKLEGCLNLNITVLSELLEDWRYIAGENSIQYGRTKNALQYTRAALGRE